MLYLNNEGFMVNLSSALTSAVQNGQNIVKGLSFPRTLPSSSRFGLIAGAVSALALCIFVVYTRYSASIKEQKNTLIIGKLNGEIDQKQQEIDRLNKSAAEKGDGGLAFALGQGDVLKKKVERLEKENSKLLEKNNQLFDKNETAISQLEKQVSQLKAELTKLRGNSNLETASALTKRQKTALKHTISILEDQVKSQRAKKTEAKRQQARINEMLSEIDKLGDDVIAGAQLKLNSLTPSEDDAEQKWNDALKSISEGTTVEDAKNLLERVLDGKLHAADFQIHKATTDEEKYAKELEVAKANLTFVQNFR